MTTQSIFLGFLLLHLTGVIIFAGTSLIDFVTLRQFWKQYGRDRSKAGGVLQAMVQFPLLMRIGIIDIILTGVGMMGITHGVFGEQVWFRIKFGLVLLLILNYLLVGRRQVTALRQAVEQNAGDSAALVMKRKSSLDMFQLAQLFLFFIIILLSVFKFN